MYRSWSIFWAIWFGVSLGTFLAVETYALLTDKNRTLSEAIWRWERLIPGQTTPISQWTAFHFLFIGVFLVLIIWLAGHFALGIWR